ncbi:MAG: 3-oxoacyl-[acyl-carrier protein] reductase [Mycobacterium sp.]|jgi:3-oxoacyl-[acyl-carrier protein] reductase|nr:3-oxoacyl-[acyl-carrier protein] reductase [Mycobacterium sp.]
MFALDNKNVLVTGATKGIGYGIAAVFSAAGANVAIAARSQPDVDAAVAKLDTIGPGRAIGVTVDVTDPESCQLMADSAFAAFGGVDVLCANAGVFPEAPLDTMTPADLASVLDVNVKGTFYCVQVCLDALTRSGAGRVVITSSITGPVTGYPGWSHYGASKAAQLGFMRTAAIELASRNITVNAILPGNILTEGLMEMGEDYRASMARAIPAGTLGTPEDIGHLAAFLATDEARYITGQSIVVDGGQILPESLAALTE